MWWDGATSTAYAPLSFFDIANSSSVDWHHRACAMDDEIKSQAEAGEEILNFDVPDAALERTASAERQAFTWVYCTNGYYWYDCSWPQ
jgi:hypothetical protein